MSCFSYIPSHSPNPPTYLVHSRSPTHPPTSVKIEIDSEGYVGVPSNFTWRSEEVGELHIEGNKGRLDMALPGFSAHAEFHDRVPWSHERPEVDGPEVGWVGWVGWVGGWIG